MFERYVTFTAAVAASLTAVGCGGGGSGGAPADNAPPAPSYTVGGMVSGLAGSGLVIRNGAVDLPISASGTFTFSAALTSGTAYLIRVVTQPAAPAQTCVITNGSGTIGSADVANVMVACTTNPLRLTSSTPTQNATGVDRDGNLTLEFSAPLDPATIPDNVFLQTEFGFVTATTSASGNTLTIDPQTRLAMRTHYRVVVFPGLRGAHGEALASEVALRFDSADGTWQTARLLETNDEGNATSPQVAINANGEAVAVWQQNRAFISNIWSASFSPGTGWASPVLIESSTVNALYAQVAIDASGNATAVWAQGSADALRIWSNRRAALGAWGTAQTIDTTVVGYGGGSPPQIAMDPDGNARVVWSQADRPPGGVSGQQADIWANRYSVSAGSWGIADFAATFRPVNDQDAIDPQITIDSVGNPLMVWNEVAAHDQPGIAGRIHASFGTGSAGWLPPVLLDDSAQPGSVSPRIATDGGGNAAAVWQRLDPSSGIIDIWSSHFTNAGGWDAAQRIESSRVNASTPKIAGARFGEPIAIWLETNGAVIDVWSNRYSPQTGWANAERVEELTGAAGDVQIAMQADGAALAIWTHIGEGARHNIMANRYTPGIGWGTPVRIGTTDSEIVAAPQIKIDGSGAALAVWQQLAAGARQNIWANRFE